MSDAYAPTSHRSNQAAERENAPHAVSGAWGATVRLGLLICREPPALPKRARAAPTATGASGRRLVAAYTNVSVLIISGSPIVHALAGRSARDLLLKTATD